MPAGLNTLRRGSPIRQTSKEQADDASLRATEVRASRRIAELDGMRGMAILLVVIWHYLVDGGVEAFHPALRLLRIGFSGVDLFFVLSGFLIGGILIDTKSSTEYYRPFCARRFFRIAPLYFLLLLVFLMGRLLVSHSHLLGSYFHSNGVPVWPYFVLGQNLFMAASQSFGFGLLAMTWSIALEQQFYLLLPSVVRMLSMRVMFWAILGAVLAAPLFRTALILSGNRYYGPYLLLPSRMDALGLGILLAMAWRHRAAWEWLRQQRRFVRLALAALSAGMLYFAYLGNLHGRLVNSGGYSWIAGFYAVLMLLVIQTPDSSSQAPSPLSKVFRSKFLTRLGTVSFAVCLLHQGVNAVMHFLLRNDTPSSSEVGSLGVSLIAAVVTYLLAEASWKWLEAPLLRAGRRQFPYQKTPPTAPPFAVASGALPCVSSEPAN